MASRRSRAELHTESPYRPEEPTRRSSPWWSGRRRAARADDADATGDRPAHAREPADRRALHDDRRGRHVAGRGAAGGAEASDGGAACAHLPRLRRRGRRSRRWSEFPVLNASVDGRGDRLPRRRQPRDRGRARRRADRPRDPAGPAAQPRGAGGRDRRPRRAGSRGELEPDEVHGGTFTITNPGQFGAVLATPIINQPQVAILDLEAIVKRPVVVEGPEGDAIAIRPMTYLLHVVGPPRPRRRRGGEVPRRGSRQRLEGGRRVMANEVDAEQRTAGGGRAVALAGDRARSRSTRGAASSGAGERSGAHCVVAVHSTVLGPALGGVRMWHYPSAERRRSATRCGSPRHDLQGGRRRARPRRRQGRDLRARRAGTRAERRRAALLDFGDLVESLGGRYITAEDVGTTPDDMDVIAERTRTSPGCPPSAAAAATRARSPRSASRPRSAPASQRALRRPRARRAPRRGLGARPRRRDLAERPAPTQGAELIVADIDAAKRAAAEAARRALGRPERRARRPSATCSPRAPSAACSTSDDDPRAALPRSSAAPPTTSSPTTALADLLERARDPLRARLRHQRRRPDQRLPRVHRLRRGARARRWPRGIEGTLAGGAASRRRSPGRSPLAAACERARERLDGAARARLSAMAELMGACRAGLVALRGGVAGRRSAHRNEARRREAGSPTSCCCSSTLPSHTKGRRATGGRAANGRGLVPDAGDRGGRDRPRRAGHLPRSRAARGLPDHVALREPAPP